MDNIDTEIIEALRKNARTPFMGIAKKLKVSEGTIRKRVSNLVKDKVIEKFTIETGRDIMAIVGIQTETKKHTGEIVDRIEKIGASTMFEVTGRYDIICMIPGPDMHTMNEKLEKIRTIPGVQHTETFTVLDKR